MFIASLHALVFAHLSLSTGDSNLITKGRQVYGSSLTSIRKTIQHPESADRALLQNAILIISMFEFYDACLAAHTELITIGQLEASGTDSNRWMIHAKGVEIIMKLQGPLTYLVWGENRFTYIILRDVLVILAYRTNAACFLNSPLWRPVIWHYEVEPLYSCAPGFREVR